MCLPLPKTPEEVVVFRFECAVLCPDPIVRCLATRICYPSAAFCWMRSLKRYAPNRCMYTQSMSYTQGILVSVSSILNNSLMSKQTVGFFPTLHGTIQTIAIQTITVPGGIILKSKQTQGFFPTRQRNSFGIPLPKRQLVCRFNLKLIFLFFLSNIPSDLLPFFVVVEFIQENKSVVRVLFIIGRGTLFSHSILIADSLSEYWVFSRPSN